jgi:hypothetical protein
MIQSGEESFVLGTAVPVEHKRVHAVVAPLHTVSTLTVYQHGSPATAA